MAKRFEVTVAPDYKFPTVRSAGRKFSKGEIQIVHEGEQGWEEIVNCPILQVTELPPRPALPEVDATNGARELARERGIDLSTVEGTGMEGRILKRDVEREIAEWEAAEEAFRQMSDEPADGEDEDPGSPEGEIEQPEQPELPELPEG